MVSWSQSGEFFPVFLAIFAASLLAHSATNSLTLCPLWAAMKASSWRVCSVTVRFRRPFVGVVLLGLAMVFSSVFMRIKMRIFTIFIIQLSTPVVKGFWCILIRILIFILIRIIIHIVIHIIIRIIIRIKIHGFQQCSTESTRSGNGGIGGILAGGDFYTHYNTYYNVYKNTTRTPCRSDTEHATPAGAGHFLPLCLSGERKSFCWVQGAFFKKPPCWGAVRRRRGKAPFL